MSTDNKEDIELQMFALMRRYSEWDINRDEKNHII